MCRTTKLVRWTCILAAHMARECEAIIVKNNDLGDPCCYTYQSDGWSAFVSETTTAYANGTRIVRSGRVRKEFLLERSVIRSIDAGGNIRARLRSTPPRPMDERAVCWYVLQAASEHFPTLRNLGDTGAVASFYCQDGLFKDSFIRRNRARHRLWYEESVFDGDEDDRWIQMNTDFVFGARCRGHIGSSAVRWGNSRLASEQIMEDIHVAIRSLRSTAHLIHKKVDQFLVRNVVWDASIDGGWDIEERKWQALGVDVQTMAKF